jgi:FKBP-type peptidyl-prolyl cis-trans isomerase
MKLLVITVLAVALWAGQACAEDTSVLKTRKDAVSYALGVDIARNFKKQELDVDPELLMRGVRDGLAGGKLLVSEKELRSLMGELQNEMRKQAVLSRRIASGDNKKKGAEFLAANRGRDGVVALPSGVQYKVLKTGDGRKPSDADTVECYYRGTLIDGTEFDGTDAGKPAQLKVTQLVAGWREAVKLMPAGSKWQIFIPGQLAYGERGLGNDIGPNEALVYEVELLAVK